MTIARLNNVMNALGKVARKVAERDSFGDDWDQASTLHEEAISLLAKHMPEGVSVPLQQYQHYGQLAVDRRGLVFKLIGLDGENGEVVTTSNYERVLPPAKWDNGKTLGQIDEDAACEFHWQGRVEGLQFARLVVATYELAELLADVSRLGDNMIGLHYVQVQSEVQRVVRAMRPLADRLEKFEPLKVYSEGATALITRHGLSLMPELAPAAVLARIVGGRRRPGDEKWDEPDVLTTEPTYSMGLAAGLLQLIHDVGAAMINEGDFDADQGEQLLNALTPWEDYLGASNAALATGHAWVSERTGPNVFREDPDALTVWRCAECGCRAVGDTVEGPEAAAFECYWIDGKPAEREPYEYVECYGDEPVDGTQPPPKTCAEVRARDGKKVA
jgi:hypothetical protein